jgi:hypothetical protein
MRSCAVLTLILFAMAIAAASPGADSPGVSPPPDLVRLEREVGLKVAHARDEGPVEPEKRKLLFEAQQSEFKGEQALKAGDYDSARDYFEHADDALKKLGL